jgi:hypothetical protein
MKAITKSIFLALFFFSAFQSFAQLSIGARAGVRFAKMDGLEDAILDIDNMDLELEFNTLLGVETGAIIAYQFSPLFSLQGEITYVQKGAEFSFEESLVGQNFKSVMTLNINYLEFAPLAKFSFGDGIVDAFVQAGPSIGYGLNGELKTSFTFDGLTETETDDLDFEEDGFSRTDFGAIFGAGVTFNLGTVNLFVDGRYSLGFTNINDGDDEAEIDVTNRGMSATVGVLIPLGQ